MTLARSLGLGVFAITAASCGSQPAPVEAAPKVEVEATAVAPGPDPAASRAERASQLPTPEPVAPRPTADPAPPLPAAEPTAEPAADLAATAEPASALRASFAIQEIRGGRGKQAREGDTVVVNYVGKLANGTEFDATTKRGPFVASLGKKQLIPGFERGIIGMRAGGKRRVVIPPELGYGSKGGGGKIPPDSVLVFEIELVEIR